MKFWSIVAAAVCVATPAPAHDFWIQPERFAAEAGQPLPITLKVGDGAEQQRSPIPLRRITKFGVMSASGFADQRAALSLGQGAADATLALPSGTHVVVLETDNGGRSRLPADRFNAYLEDEGLTPILEHRRRAGLTGVGGSERYGRRAKAIVRLGAGASAATRAIGMTLEIVPQVDPYAADRGDPLPVQVRYEGAPLAGALVKLTRLDDGAVRETHRTDGDGRAVFTAGDGAWRLTTVWSKPLPAGEDADFETVFASLTFGAP